MSHSCCKTEREAAADDPVANMLLHRCCRTNWYGVINAAVTRPLHSPRSASRIALIGVTFSRPCLFSSIHRSTDCAVHPVTGRLMRPGPGTGRGLCPGLVTGGQTGLADCLGSHLDPAAVSVNLSCAASEDPVAAAHPRSLVYSPDLFPFGRHALWAGAGS